MKNQKGITLIALIVYIIVMLIVISIISIITTSMTTNLGNVEKSSKSVSKINKFDMYFLEDIKKSGISIYDIKNDDTNKYIILENGEGNTIQYIFKNNIIYRIDNNTQIQICNGITNFQASKDQTNNNVIKIIIQASEYTSEKNYKVGKW